jgi:DNA-binding CsgD family transcriptional regulator/tetratricopeptide (TPR) repeat protein
MLERDAELVYLGSCLRDAREGRGGIVAVEGPAGIGKSMLLAAAAQLARELGLELLKARGGELEEGMAFGAVRQLLEPAVLSMGSAERRRLLAGPAMTGACALGLQAGEAPGDEFAALHGLYWLCANFAERRPLLMTVDDLQWVDGPSLSWLQYLGRRVFDLSMLVVVSVREGHPRASAPAVAGIVGDPAAGRLRLSPLGAGGVAAVVREELGLQGSPEFCRVCRELTGGNPLYLRQLITAAHAEGLTGSATDVAALEALAPSAVGGSVLARLARMGPDMTALARAVAVLGAGTEVAVAAELAGLTSADAELAADALTAAQVLAAARPLEFFHPLIAEAVYADLALGARRLAHRRAAAIVDRHGAVDRVAAHLLGTGPAGDLWVAGRLAAAARDAADRGAPDLAAGYLRRALSEPPAAGEHPALLLRLGLAEWHAGEPDAIGHLEQALATARDPATTSAAAESLAQAYRFTGRADMGVAALQRAIAQLRDTDPWLAFSLESSCALAAIMDDRTAQEALRSLDSLSRRMSEFAEPPPFLLAALANVAMRRQQPGQAQQLVDRALAGQPYPPPLACCPTLVSTLIALERHDLLGRLCDDLLAAARRRSALQEAAAIASFAAWALYRRGELADAEAQARWAAERATGVYLLHAVAQLVEPLIERGSLDEAAAELERVGDPLAAHSITATTFLFARGRLHAARGRPADALRDFLECGQRSGLFGRVSVMYHWRSEAALAHVWLGNEHEAMRLAREEVDLARQFGRPGALGIALRNCGLVEGGDRGLVLLAEAVRTLEDAQSPVELARTQVEYGSALRRAGQRLPARAQLERGLDLAHHSGARRIADRARAELVAVGAKPRRDAITGRDALTASELRVARLAAEGMTNRQIAQALFITTKTVAVHLTHVYRKLGVSRRVQLSGALAGQLPDPEAATIP